MMLSGFLIFNAFVFRLFQEEKARKTEVGQLKMRYDSRVSLLSEELTTLQSQVCDLLQYWQPLIFTCTPH